MDSEQDQAQEQETARLREVKGPDGAYLVGTVRGRQIKFVVGIRQSLAYDLAVQVHVNPIFTRAAAIGLCWLGADKPTAAALPFTNAVTWGSAVLDALFAAKWHPDDIREIGQELLDRALMSLPDWPAMEAEAGPLG